MIPEVRTNQAIIRSARMLITVLAGFASAIFARSAPISGIAVGNLLHKAEKRTHLVVYTIRNNVVSADTLLRAIHEASGGTTDILAPVINSYGTHTAFFRKVGNTWRISVMKIGSTEVKDLCQVPVAVGGDVFADWPKGTGADADNWVYFVPDRWHFHLYRVNVQTGQLQDFLTMGYDGMFPCSMTWDARYIYGYVRSDFDNMGIVKIPSAVPATLPMIVDTALSWWKEGCGHCIGPNGTYQSSNVGTAHYARVMTRVDSPLENSTSAFVRSYRVTYLNTLWNEWALDGNAVGNGITHYHNRYSRNSDRWQVLQISEGRECVGGCDLVIMNFMDSATLNISRLPVAFTEGGVDNHDFWLQAPLDQICEPLRDDVNDTNRSRYSVAGLGGPSGVRPALSNRSGSDASISLKDRIVSVGFPDRGVHTVAAYDPSGRCLVQRTVSGSTASFILPWTGIPGVMLIRAGNTVRAIRID